MSTSVIAINDIAQGTCSLPGVGNINMMRLLEKCTSSTYFHVEVRGGYLTINEEDVEQNWAFLIAVARNCHEQNVELTKSSCGLILRATRPIKISEELFVWIGSDLLLELEFPFLKPFNIKGNQDYECHICGHIFQNPNPLKVHLLFQCGGPKSFTSVTEFNNNNVKTSFQFKCLESAKPFETVIRTPIVKKSVFPVVVYPRERPTDCLPFITTNSGNLRSLQIVTSPRNDCGSISQKYDTPDLSPGSSSKTWLDKSTKQSIQTTKHICPYCGKVYSRKYGLKIHVRTHTGYKPLKCKYCFRPFSDPSNLNKHVRLHSESDTPYRCPICGKVLVRRRDLQRHIKSRHQGDSFEDSERIAHSKIAE